MCSGGQPRTIYDQYGEEGLKGGPPGCGGLVDVSVAHVTMAGRVFNQQHGMFTTNSGSILLLNKTQYVDSCS